MRVIDQVLVHDIWQEMATYSEERAGAEARGFLERQPHVAELCRSATTEFDDRAKKTALGLAFLLFRVVETSLAAPLPTLTRQRLDQAYRVTTEWLEQWEGADPRVFLRSVQVGGAFAHPNVVQYLLTAFYGGDGESVEYDAEVKATLFLLLTTLADALDTGDAEETS